MGIELDLTNVNDLDGGRSGDAFLKLNPFGQVPVLVDEDLVLRDSLAILRYLARRYGPAGWWPKDPKTQAEIDAWFGTAASFVFLGPNRARLIRKMGAGFSYDEAQSYTQRLFTAMDAHLDGRDWLVGAHVTLADVACYSYIAVAHEGDQSPSDTPNIHRWMRNLRGLSGFFEMPGA